MRKEKRNIRIKEKEYLGEGLAMTDLERQFTKDMMNIYTTAKRECGYQATRFLQLVGEKGGVNAAKQLIHKQSGTEGFAALWEHRRLDLSVEAHVLKPEYKTLFTEEECKICKERLSDFGFHVEE